MELRPAHLFSPHKVDQAAFETAMPAAVVTIEI
jgi:hypothetical protein